MALTYKFNDDKNTEENPPAENADDAARSSHVEKYNDAGHLRYIIFDDHKGTIFTRYYSYLGNVNFDQSRNEIRLEFNEDVVTLKGQNMMALFEELSAQLIRKLEPLDKRYGALMDKSDYYVTEISFSRIQK